MLSLSICASVQLVLALPFLTTYPVEYLKGAFDLGRVFMFKWTVNFKVNTSRYLRVLQINLYITLS